jgi:UDP-2,4-diacetamido-2,4,6-trideoxy-beta-L-altropyranose hydrolase
VGGGHVMRCLTLAEALAAEGVTCTFALAPTGNALVARFAERPFKRLPRGSDSDLASAASGFDLLVIDDYRIDARLESAIQSQGQLILVIDDLANRAHRCDILVDPGYGRVPQTYDPWLPAAAVRLVGPAYALVRRSFTQRREMRLQAHVPVSPRRFFISFGLSDVEGVAARATALARGAFPNAEIDVALSSAAQSLPALQTLAASDPALHLHIDSTKVAALMASADLALGAGGGSTWERACLGLPTLAVVVADNQREMIGRMAAQGLLLSVDLHAPDFESDLTHALDLMGEAGLRRRLREASAGLCDGRGAARIAEAIGALRSS